MSTKTFTAHGVTVTVEKLPVPRHLRSLYSLSIDGTEIARMSCPTGYGQTLTLWWTERGPKGLVPERRTARSGKPQEELAAHLASLWASRRETLATYAEYAAHREAERVAAERRQQEALEADRLMWEGLASIRDRADLSNFERAAIERLFAQRGA